MFNWFRKDKVTEPPQVVVDMHSHLLPGLDDGVSTFEEAEAIVRHLIKLGYTRIITTPHVMSDAYRNTPAGIVSKLAELNDYLAGRDISISVSAAAEYYLDEALFKMV